MFGSLPLRHIFIKNDKTRAFQTLDVEALGIGFPLVKSVHYRLSDLTKLENLKAFGQQFSLRNEFVVYGSGRAVSDLIAMFIPMVDGKVSS